MEKKNNDGYNTVHNKKKNKETITCIDMTCLSTQHWLVLCKNKPKCSETLFYDCLYYILLKMCFYSIPHCDSFTFIWPKMSNFKSSRPFGGVIKQNKITLGWQEADCNRFIEVAAEWRFFTLYIAVIFSGTLATEKTKM